MKKINDMLPNDRLLYLHISALFSPYQMGIPNQQVVAGADSSTILCRRKLKTEGLLRVLALKDQEITHKRQA